MAGGAHYRYLRFQQGFLHEGEGEEGAGEAEEGAGNQTQGGGAFAQAEQLGATIPGYRDGKQAQHPPGDAAQALFHKNKDRVGQE